MAEPPRKRTVTVAENRRLTRDVHLLRCRLPPGDALRFDPGQFVTFYVRKGAATVTRSYSICSDPSSAEEFDLCIKKVEGGYVSTHLCERAVGDALNAVGPLGRFLLREPNDRPAVFVATGTGIAPFRPMVDRLLAQHPHHPTWLFAGYRYAEDLLFHDELSARAEREPSFRYVPVLSRPPDTWTGARGHVQGPLEAALPNLAGCDVYVCGVPPMVAEVLALAERRGCPRERTFVERY